MLENTEGAIKKGKSRETGNIGYTLYVGSFSGFSFLIAPSVFSNIYLSSLLCTSMLPVSLDFPF
jgi:hypothetical protein